MLEHSDFYATVAQVIPVLFLALAIEQRVFRPDDDEPLGVTMWIVGFVGMSVLAELVALIALKEGRQPTNIEDAVILPRFCMA